MLTNERRVAFFSYTADLWGGLVEVVIPTPGNALTGEAKGVAR
jgi:hypothetical protein